MKRAHDLRATNIRLKATVEPISGVVERQLQPILVEIGEVPHETTFTVTNEWLMMAYKALDPFETKQLGVVNSDDLQKLHGIFCSRLEQHIVRRISNAEKHDHWCWHFVRQNLFCVSALMIMMGHII